MRCEEPARGASGAAPHRPYFLVGARLFRMTNRTGRGGARGVRNVVDKMTLTH
jgi:hypothetical protein